MKAEAVVFTAPGDVSFDVVECPDPGPDDVVVRVLHSWISNGTEGSVLRGERIAGDTPWREGDPDPFPVVPGYQKVGIVEHVGRDVVDIGVGDRVFAAMSRLQGMFRPVGGHISPSSVPQEFVWRLPDAGEPAAFSGAVLTQVGFNCGSRPCVSVGDPAVVLGDGLVGQWTAQTLAWRGAEVLLAGHHDQRLACFGGARRRHVANVSDRDVAEVIDAYFPQKAAVVVDTAGSIDGFSRAATRVRHGGHLVSAGFYGIKDALSLQPLREAELYVHLVSGWTRERVSRTLELIAGDELQTLPLVTHRFPAREAKAAWSLIRSRGEHVLGVLLDWES